MRALRWATRALRRATRACRWAIFASTSVPYTRRWGSFQVLGTGGTILAGLKTSVSAFKNLKRLQLQNLFLDADDGFGILNSFVDCKSLRDIDAFNLTKEATTTLDPNLFSELEVKDRREMTIFIT